MNYNNQNRTLIFDESGNLGKDGRYFVIACVDTNKTKSLHNGMQKKLLKIRNKFSYIKRNAYEIKANFCDSISKFEIIEYIHTKDLKIHYIISDLEKVKFDLGSSNHKNLFYNFLMKLLIDNIISDNFKNENLNIYIDNKTIKVGSENSFEEYIKIHLLFERVLNLNISVKYIDSNSKYGFIIQVADFVANSIYSHYEFTNNSYYNILKDKIIVEEKFPKYAFKNC